MLGLGLPTRNAFAILACLVDTEAGFLKSDDLIARTGLPPEFLRKVIGRLVKGGILVARRGSLGGYHLGAPPESVTLFQVVKVVEGHRWDRAEHLAWDDCPALVDLRVHWMDLLRFLAGHTVQDLRRTSLS